MEKLGRSLIHHGKSNDRIYLMKCDRQDLPDLPRRLVQMASARGYSRIIAKVPAPAAEAFQEAQYRVEARVPGFFQGETDGLFFGRCLADWRRCDDRSDHNDRVLSTAYACAEKGAPDLPEGFTCRALTAADCVEAAAIYREVFTSYPFPIHDPAYLQQTMASHIVYYGVFAGSTLAALASAEMYADASNVEMTDFATRLQFRGNGLAAYLLAKMEQDMSRRGIATAYTMARAGEYGMNVTFSKLGYRYAGRLINNTHIAGSFESMNIWYNPLNA